MLYSDRNNSENLQLLPALFSSALDELLKRNRITTLETWVDFAVRRQYEFPLLYVAEAETARRRGNFEMGEIRALQAATTLPTSAGHLIARSYALAGECAHHDYRPLDALRHHTDGGAFADTAPAKTRALWGQFTAAVQIESDDADDFLW